MDERMIRKLSIMLESMGFVTWITVDLVVLNEALEFVLKLLSLISFVLVIIINYDKVINIFKGKKNESNS